MNRHAGNSDTTLYANCAVVNNRANAAYGGAGLYVMSGATLTYDPNDNIEIDEIIYA